jgi:hypothetical protein
MQSFKFLILLFSSADLNLVNVYFYTELLQLIWSSY